MRSSCMQENKVGKGASTPQAVINELIVEYALQGKLVVRLKGGDVSIFSNMLDELKCIDCKINIPYEIIPGITAAAGAAAYAGIPLTARIMPMQFAFLLIIKQICLKKIIGKNLAETDDTLVFYMSSDTLDELVSKLLQYKIANDRHIAVIEQATTPMQNVYSCNIHEYAKKWGGNNYVSPTLIIIGKVAALHQQFQWMTKQQ